MSHDTLSLPLVSWEHKVACMGYIRGPCPLPPPVARLQRPVAERHTTPPTPIWPCPTPSLYPRVHPPPPHLFFYEAPVRPSEMSPCSSPTLSAENTDRAEREREERLVDGGGP